MRIHIPRDLDDRERRRRLLRKADVNRPLSATELERSLRATPEDEAPIAAEHGAVIWDEAALPILQASSDGAFASEREEHDGQC